MSWDEFSTLLYGIMPDTPLGQVVDIRMEEDKERLKSFSPAQHKIRNDWRNRAHEALTEKEKEVATTQIQQMFKDAFG